MLHIKSSTTRVAISYGKVPKQEVLKNIGMNECDFPKYQAEKMVPKSNEIYAKHRKWQSEVIL